MDLLVGQAGEQLLRLRHRQRRRARQRVPDHQAPHLQGRGSAHHPSLRGRGAPAVREGARRSARPAARLPAGVDRQHLGDELRLAVRQRHRGAQPRGRAGRLHARHRRGRPVAVPPQRRRPGLPDRHVVLRVPRRQWRLRPRPPQGPGRRGAGAGDRDQAVAGSQARSRRHAAGGEGDRGDRRRSAASSRASTARRPAGTRRSTTSTRCSTSWSWSRPRPACRWASSRPSARWACGTSWSAFMAGERRAGRGLREHRRRRGRHRRGAADLRGRRLVPVPGRVRAGLQEVRGGRPDRRRDVHGGRQARRARERRRRLRPRRGHGQRRPARR